MSEHPSGQAAQPANVKAAYVELGRYLRHVREGHRLDLNAVAAALHIRAKYLSALEEGKLQDLPGVVYARGYLQNYAEYLGLDREEVMTRFQQAVDGGAARHAPLLPPLMHKENGPGAWVMVVSGVCLLAALAGAAFYSRSSLQGDAAGRVDALPAEYEAKIAPFFVEKMRLRQCLEGKGRGLYPYCIADADVPSKSMYTEVPVLPQTPDLLSAIPLEPLDPPSLPPPAPSPHRKWLQDEGAL